MVAQTVKTTQERPLEILGITEAEEHAYRWLLNHPRTTVPEAAQALALTSGKTQRLLDAIETKGLVTHSPERPRRYIPMSPDIALKALMHRRQESLQHADAAIRELQEQTASQLRGEQELMVELITSREAERQVFEQLHKTVEREIVALIRAPVRISRLDIPTDQDQYSQRNAQTRGVNYRGITDREFLNLPGALHAVRNDLESGQEIRIATHLPFKMILADRRIAIIPLNLQKPDSPSLLVRSSALLDALYALFEILWERAAPLSFTRTGAVETGAPDSFLPKATEKLIWLMAAGLNDKKIAGELGISASTLKRRIAQLTKAFDARTRFQLGRLTERPFPVRGDKQR